MSRNLVISQAIQIAISNLKRLDTLNDTGMLDVPDYNVPVYCVSKVKVEMENIEAELQKLIGGGKVIRTKKAIYFDQQKNHLMFKRMLNHLYENSSPDSRFLLAISTIGTMLLIMHC